MNVMHPPRYRAVFVINSMTSGGAERVMSELLQHLQDALQEVDVYLLLLDRKEPCYPIPDYVQIICLNSAGSLLPSIIGTTLALRRIKPDVVLSFLHRANVANVLASILLRHTCLISVRSNTSQLIGHGFKAWLLKHTFKLLYPLADKVIAVSKGVSTDLQHHFCIPAQRLQVIYNPYDLKKLQALAQLAPTLPHPKDYIVSVGRLEPCKNFDRLIRAYHLSGLSLKLLILGEGPEQTKLQHLIYELGLEDRVMLLGFLKNPFPIIKRARFGVFASSREGFPNAMAEAMALSLPVIATDCESGPAEIVQGVVRLHCDSAFKASFGVLVPVDDEFALAIAMNWMEDNALHQFYQLRSSARIAGFGCDKIVAQYRNLILQKPMQIDSEATLPNLHQMK